MKRFLQVALLGGLIAILAVAVIEWEISQKLRTENQILAAEISSIKSLQEATSAREHKSDAGMLKTEQEELLRLRSEVGKLREQMTELERLQTENQRLKEGIKSNRDDIQGRWKLRFSELSANYTQPSDYLNWIPGMNEALTNSDPWVRNEAAKLLRVVGVERLLNTNLTTQDLAELKIVAKAAVPGLLPALKDSDPLVCANAAITLGFLHEDTEQVVPALIENLNSDQPRIVGSAAKALGRLQGDARSAWEALLPLAQSPNPDLRQVAVGSLIQIDPVAAHNAGFQELP